MKSCALQNVMKEGETERLIFAAAGGEISLGDAIKTEKRYLLLKMELLEEHSGAFELCFFAENPQEPRMTIRFGILPGLQTPLCFDFHWLDGHVLFPGNTPGALKFVCHGSRIARSEITHVVLRSRACFHDQRVRIWDMYLSDEKPNTFSVQEKKLVDSFGQTKEKSWKGKIHSTSALRTKLQERLTPERPGIPGRNQFGGDLGRQLQKGTGYFTKIKQNDRWYLVDPQGCAFFSMGPDCINVPYDARIDGIEQLLDWVPEPGTAEYTELVEERPTAYAEVGRKLTKGMSFVKKNLQNVWGDKWFENWLLLTRNTLCEYGLNTIGNWSDSRLFDSLEIPYVTSLKDFPDTQLHIFRDFPDVYSSEYAVNAGECAKSLKTRCEDPFMIGYFLRNEPGWAFVDNLIIADEVFYNPAQTETKARLIAQLAEKYESIAALNEAYQLRLESFDALNNPVKALSGCSPQALADMKAFSREMIRRYIEIPANACREVDKNHMILGMRWAWISDPDIVSGWENFDVFSINCYATDPTASLENVRKLGVDLPVMIGEFHFGALDAGPTATGLEAVKTQKDRGVAYQHYCEHTAAHPNGVGCHYFQYYDQFPLGRFDGENYNIGMLDVCSQPYEEMMEHVLSSSLRIYDIMDGEERPAEEQADSIPMIAY